MNKQFTISIVGRANVGKSTIFNRIIGKKKAMVSNIPRVTRDRNIELVEHYDHPFTLIDTGGFEKEKDDVVSDKIEEQIKSAIEMSNVLFFVVDGKSGITPMDRQLLKEVRRIRADFDENIYLLINKVDQPEKHGDRELDFYELGVPNMISVSGEFNIGVNELIDDVLEKLPKVDEPEIDENVRIAMEAEEKEEKKEKEEKLPRIVVLGKPNVGKSSLINKVVGEKRVIVDAHSGTTRDPVDIKVNWLNRDFIFVDTAGMRRRSKVTESVEKLSIMFAEREIDDADIVLLMIDASDEPSDQDIRMAKLIEEKYKSLIVVMNKSDLLREKDTTKNAVKEKVRDKLHFLSYVPVNFISVLTGEGFDALYKKILEVEAEYSRKIPTSKLNKFFHANVTEHSVPIRQGKRPKIYYLTQERSSPPTFLLFCNHPGLIEKSYRKYIQNKFRKEFNFLGTPIRFVYKKK
jgi:GTP-binding protein